MWMDRERERTEVHSAGVPAERATQAANDPGRHPRPTAYPSGTRAVIRRRGHGPLTSGKARAGDWILSFQPTSAPFIEPLMGWCGGTDPLRHVELRFPSREAAVRFAERRNLPYELIEARGGEQPASGMPLWTGWMRDRLAANTNGQPARDGTKSA
ncbi:NADH dehydrogenase ubiquinone Fe-S protein 4 [Azospirillum sp. SYSU D00513]|uniref:NADH dehydrogenase ubiquinone Fe-S protein 4 n=1 Tax=Azospirillum sp. SYSU D00513 TaxID=2812561 RepID=UPI001A974010|nr:NADH dehydrogenase ubiquinone Fe-S protein 4 [Azospirillum sp. SYSU D00513]